MKKLFIGFVVFIGLAALGTGLYYVFNKSEKPYNFVPYNSSNIHDVDVKSFTTGDRLLMEKKITEIKKVIEKFDTSTPAKNRNSTYFILASYQQSLGQYMEAKKTLETTLELKVYPNILVAYSQLLYAAGEKDAARKYLSDAISLDKKNPEYWRVKIQAETEINPKDELYLESIYQNALKATNNHIDIVTIYAQFLAKFGHTKQAIQMWEKAIAIYPEDKALYQQEIDALKK